VTDELPKILKDPLECRCVMPKAAHSFCVKFTLVGRALSRAGFVTDLPAEGRSTPTHRHFRPSRRECGMPNVTFALILSAGVRGHRLPSPPCSVQNLLVYFGFPSQ